MKASSGCWCRRSSRGSRPYRPAMSARQLLERGLDLGAVTLRIHLREDLPDLAVRADDERGAFDAHVLPAPEGFFDPESVPLGDFVILVGEQGEREVVFLLEVGVLAG